MKNKKKGSSFNIKVKRFFVGLQTIKKKFCFGTSKFY